MTDRLLKTAQYDVECEEDGENGESVPVIYPSKIEYGVESSDNIKTGDESDYDGTVEFGESFVADRQAYLEIKKKDEEIAFDSDDTSAVVAFGVTLRDRNNGEIEVKDSLLTVRIKLTN